MRKHTSPERPAIPVRRPRFSFPVDRSRHWYDGKMVTLMAHALSPLFPAGELFFIRSVVAFRDQIKDPQLLAEIRQFVAQEGVHTAAHIKYDASVQPHYDMHGMEKDTEFILSTVSRVLQRLDGVVLDRKRFELAITVGLEHFTALLGEQLLLNREHFNKADPAFAQLWFWHAVEEIEHKAVAFDVFEAVGGTWVERVSAFLIATAAIYVAILTNLMRMLRTDDALLRTDVWAELVWFCLFDPGMFRHAAKHYVDYLRPDFHPWDHDNRELIAKFKAWYDAEVAVAAA
jgi:predicted metal-dependent hydrolase